MFVRTPSERRRARLEAKLKDLIDNFSDCLREFEYHGPFDKPAQLNSHLRTIRRRRALGSAAAAAADAEFCEGLHAALHNGVEGGDIRVSNHMANFGPRSLAVNPNLHVLMRCVLATPLLILKK